MDNCLGLLLVVGVCVLLWAIHPIIGVLGILFGLYILGGGNGRWS